jgi:hypothetical protein
MPDYSEQITSVTLRREPCFGRCPVYEVTLAADGHATYDGVRFVDRLGRYQGEVDLNDYERLAHFIQRVDFLNWDDEYVNRGVTDLPNYYLTVVAGEQTKTVRQYGVDQPPDFWVIAALVDHLSGAIPWTPVTPQGTCHDWTAVYDNEPPGPGVLRVRGICTFPSAGFSVELRRHEPQGINPRDLLLDRIVHPSTGEMTPVFTDVDVEVTYIDESVDYETVTILPDGPSIAVRVTV